MSGRPRTNPLGDVILDVRTDKPIVDTDYTNANRALQNAKQDYRPPSPQDRVGVNRTPGVHVELRPGPRSGKRRTGGTIVTALFGARAIAEAVDLDPPRGDGASEVGTRRQTRRDRFQP